MKVDDLMRLEEVLRKYTLTVPDIAVRLLMSESTVRRGIKQLRSLGSDVKYREGAGWHAAKAVFNVKKKG